MKIMLQIFDQGRLTLCLYPFIVDKVPLPGSRIDICGDDIQIISLEVHALFQNSKVCNDVIVAAVLIEIQNTEIYFDYMRLWREQIKKAGR